MKKDVVVLPTETNEFVANGTTYRFEPTISIARYRKFEQFRIESGFGVSVVELAEVLHRILDYVERGFQGEKVMVPMVTLIQNALKGMVDGAQKEPYATWMCTLFFNTSEEDRHVFDEPFMRTKIVDWTEAGIDSLLSATRLISLKSLITALVYS